MQQCIISHSKGGFYLHQEITLPKPSPETKKHVWRSPPWPGWDTTTWSVWCGVLFFLSFLNPLMTSVTLLLGPWAACIRSIVSFEILPALMSCRIMSQGTSRQEHLNLTWPLSALVKCLAGLSSPMPFSYSSHGWCEVLGLGISFACKSMFVSTCPCHLGGDAWLSGCSLATLYGTFTRLLSILWKSPLID